MVLDWGTQLSEKVLRETVRVISLCLFFLPLCLEESGGILSRCETKR